MCIDINIIIINYAKIFLINYVKLRSGHSDKHGRFSPQR
jgi:hypothetical protein